MADIEENFMAKLNAELAHREQVNAKQRKLVIAIVVAVMDSDDTLLSEIVLQARKALTDHLASIEG